MMALSRFINAVEKRYLLWEKPLRVTDWQDFVIHRPNPGRMIGG